MEKRGAIASAWKTESLITATAAGFSRPAEVYLVDLRINPGNSGGPIFRRDDQAVLGMAVESKGSLGVVVPAKYIAQFLKGHGIQWMPAANT
jgi:S1-C subfamily serine protease